MERYFRNTPQGMKADVVRALEETLDAPGVILYYGYPRYRDEAGEKYEGYLVLVSPKCGVAILAVEDASRGSDSIEAAGEALDQFTSFLVSKFLTSKVLRRRKTELTFALEQILVAANLDSDSALEIDGTEVFTTIGALKAHLEKWQQNAPPMESEVVTHVLATVDGTRVIPRPKARAIAPGDPLHWRGAAVALLEARLATFDRQQREGLVTEITGPQRLRGLAGSGKTIVLAKKAALTHLDDPDATIVYTFYTKSLYQYIRRLITRFYRDHDDRDPDWEKIRVMHAWGGRRLDGVYAAVAHSMNEQLLTYSDAAVLAASTGKEAFEYACQRLLDRGSPPQFCDYMFIDEGQDYPPSFLQLCDMVTEESRWIWAYDELQTIFRPKAPTAQEVWGVNKDGTSRVEFERDTVLQRCYRNPREILVCAHALGFGIYGSRITQMLSSQEHWEELGYRFISGEFAAGKEVVIERPAENSLPDAPDLGGLREVVKVFEFDSIDTEVVHVLSQIAEQMKSGLRPDDIAVVCVDDRSAKDYFRRIELGLTRAGVRTNNMHAAIGNPDYVVDDAVTLSTVHRAKGNESFSVFVVGADAIFSRGADAKLRNMLFTAVTRAKAWVQITGSGPGARAVVVEVTAALNQFPRLVFRYPHPAELEVMERDLKAATATDSPTLVFDAMTDSEFDEYARKRRAARKRK